MTRKQQLEQYNLSETFSLPIYSIIKSSFWFILWLLHCWFLYCCIFLTLLKLKYLQFKSSDFVIPPSIREEVFDTCTLLNSSSNYSKDHLNFIYFHHSVKDMFLTYTSHFYINICENHRANNRTISLIFYTHKSFLSLTKMIMTEGHENMFQKLVANSNFDILLVCLIVK